MKKTLIRRFHGISQKPEGRNIHAMAIRAKGEPIYMMGQGGYDLDGNFVGRGDPGEQAAQACRNIKQLLSEAGASLEALCKLTVYMTDLSYRRAVYLAIEMELQGACFCRTGMVVTSLGPPEYLVEVDAIAVAG